MDPRNTHGPKRLTTLTLILFCLISFSSHLCRAGGGGTATANPLLRTQINSSNSVPKKLHFVWLGKNIPGEYINNIRSFAAHNPDYEINIWTDQVFHIESTLANNEGAAFKYKLRKLSTLDNIHPRLKSYLDRETVGVYPNFAAASDIYRVHILEKEGGIYLDTDLSAKETVAQQVTVFNKDTRKKLKIRPVLYRGQWMLPKTDISPVFQIPVEAFRLDESTITGIKNGYNKSLFASPRVNQLKFQGQWSFPHLPDLVFQAPFQVPIDHKNGPKNLEQMKEHIQKSILQAFRTIEPSGFGTIRTNTQVMFPFSVSKAKNESGLSFQQNNDVLVAKKPSGSGRSFLKEMKDVMLARYSKIDRNEPEVLWSLKRVPYRSKTKAHLRDLMKTVRFQKTVYLTGPTLIADLFYRQKNWEAHARYLTSKFLHKPCIEVTGTAPLKATALLDSIEQAIAYEHACSWFRPDPNAPARRAVEAPF